MAQRTITADDQGKRVVSADGATIGLISAVEDGIASVDPDPGVADRVRATLGRDDVGDDHYPRSPAKVDAVLADEIRLKPAL